jgi:hypothetical protein
MSKEVKGGTFNIVHQMFVDEETLEKIAELLGIPAAERGRITSGTIYIGTPPSPPSGDAPPSPLSGGAPPSPPSVRRRQRK